MITSVQAIGEFYKTDQEGHLINPASWEHVPESRHEMIHFIKESYLEIFGKNLSSLYLRGSIVRGTYVSGISDLDVVGLVSETVGPWREIPSVKKIRTKFAEKFLVDVSLELMVSDYSENMVKDYPALAMVLKLQGLCIFGVDITSELPAFKADSRLCFYYKWLEKDLLSYWRSKVNFVADRQLVMKVIIRSGFELVIQKSNLYTLDLFPAVQAFGEYYPSRKTMMEEVLYFYLNPKEDKNRQDQIIREIGSFLIQEIKSNM